MKIVLSRKGIDSASGHPGYHLRWSPILPDGKLVSLPIYRKGEAVCYEDLSLDRGRSYLDLIRGLGYDYPNRTPCHRDPDIYRHVTARPSGWRPLSGHNAPESTHLRNQGVGPGDMFLYFGLFRHTRAGGHDRLVFDGPECHMLFGYLQIEQIVPVGPQAKLPQFMDSHPHAAATARRGTGNVIYVSRRTASWDATLPGAGVFVYHTELVLTAEGHSKRAWHLPDCFRMAVISYHSAASWKDDLFYSACRGQEFVVQDNPGVVSWAKRLIESYAPVRA